MRAGKRMVLSGPHFLKGNPNMTRLPCLLIYILLGGVCHNSQAPIAEENAQGNPAGNLVARIPIEYQASVGSKPLIRARVNGGPPRYFILDTGFSFGLSIDTRVADACGVQKTGKTTSLLPANETAEMAGPV